MDDCNQDNGFMVGMASTCNNVTLENARCQRSQGKYNIIQITCFDVLFIFMNRINRIADVT